LGKAFRPLPGRRTSVNTFVIRAPGQPVVIIDTGSGTYLLNTAYQQHQNLAVARVDA